MNSYNKYYFVYIMSNKNRTVFYVGFTGIIKKRTYQHERGEIDGFTKKYNCKYLVYYEKYKDANVAILREKQVKKFSRKKKIKLILKIILFKYKPTKTKIK